jgi:hypothetical protein
MSPDAFTKKSFSFSGVRCGERHQGHIKGAADRSEGFCPRSFINTKADLHQHVMNDGASSAHLAVLNPALTSAGRSSARRMAAVIAPSFAPSTRLPTFRLPAKSQDAFVTGIAAEFPGVPRRSCDNHFLRDVAKPVLQADSHAKVQMRRKVRGLRKIEQAVLQQQRDEAERAAASDVPSDDSYNVTYNIEHKVTLMFRIMFRQLTRR